MSEQSTQIFLGTSQDGFTAELLASMANRHGLIAGATGSGKTVSLQVLAEGFSRLGVPVFTADVKGDLAGLAQSGSRSRKIEERLNQMPQIAQFEPQSYPVLLWDLLGSKGVPVRTTVSEMGPLLLARLLDLNETQQGVLEVLFKFADDEGLLVLDSKDLRELLLWAGEHLSDLREDYGMISPASVGAIQRRLLSLEESGALRFFGEPALRLEHLMQKDFSGRGVISILDASSIIQDGRLYSSFLLWLLSELFEELDEVGDQSLPRLVFFFDEAHLLFSNAPKALVEKIETVVRLIRSKGVGVYFVTQDPSDVPESVLGQLGNRIQHALRAYTPSARKNIRAVADAFRENPDIDTEEAVTQLEVGEALVSTLDASGAPQVVQRILIRPPESRIGAITAEERSILLERHLFRASYETAQDRESAYELLRIRKQQETTAAEKPKASKRSSNRQSPTEAFFKSVLRSVGSSLGRSIARGILGSILKR